MSYEIYLLLEGNGEGGEESLAKKIFVLAVFIFLFFRTNLKVGRLLGDPLLSATIKAM